MANITAANSVFILTIPNVFGFPQHIQGYMADDAFVTDEISNAELVLGVDGNLSAGWVPNLNTSTIYIMPDSPSASIFEAWFAAEKAARNKYAAQGRLTLLSVGTSYVLTGGYLTRFVPTPPVRKILQGRPSVITWQSIDPAPELSQ